MIDSFSLPAPLSLAAKAGTYEVAIVGGGPAGLTAADGARAALAADCYVHQRPSLHSAW